MASNEPAPARLRSPSLRLPSNGGRSRSRPGEPNSVERTPAPAPTHFNPILQSQIKAADADIAKHKAEQERLAKVVASYRGKVDSIPLREQEIASLTRDYEMNKAHYAQLLDRELSAETATQLEIRQKGEKFEVLDPAQPAERPSSPKRDLINAGGAIAGLTLGLLMALATELLGMSITGAQDIIDASSLKVLGVIPVIETQRDRTTRPAPFGCRRGFRHVRHSSAGSRSISQISRQNLEFPDREPNPVKSHQKSGIAGERLCSNTRSNGSKELENLGLAYLCWKSGGLAPHLLY